MQFQASSSFAQEEWQLRVDLAATFRMVARLDWHESIANHLSVAASSDGRRFLMNPKWKHFSLIKASELVLLDADDKDVMTRADAPDPTAWHIHGTLHRLVPHARCILHLHPPYGTALSCLDDPEIKPIDQTSARFFNRVAVETSYSGMADDEDEGCRLARMLGKKQVLMMGNHGVLVASRSIPEAFDTLYHLERACRTLMLAYATGQKLKVLSPQIAERTAMDWETYTDSCFAHFNETKRIIDNEDANYQS